VINFEVFVTHKYTKHVHTSYIAIYTVDKHAQRKVRQQMRTAGSSVDYIFPDSNRRYIARIGFITRQRTPGDE